MNKRTKIILLFLSTIISLIITLTTYFSLDRYINLHISPIEKYTSNYDKLNKPNKKIIISLYSSPYYISRIKPVLNSILDQTIKVNQIDLNIITNSNTYSVPSEYEKCVNIYNSGKNYNSCTHIIPTLLREKEKNTIIIALDNDIIYGKDFLEKMIETSEKYLNNAVYYKKKNRLCALLFKPVFFKVDDIINNDAQYFDNNWIISNIINKPIELKYSENYYMI